MSSKKTQILFLVSLAALFLNLVWMPFFANSQSTPLREEDILPQGGIGSTLQVTRFPFLSFNKIPDSFSFSEASTSTSEANLFSDTGSQQLQAPRALIISDTRGAGGILLQASVSGNFTIQGNGDNPNIPVSGLRVVTTDRITPIPSDPQPAATKNGLIYLAGYQGDQSIIAPLGINFDEALGCNSFSDLATFTNPACRNTVSSNTLNNTVNLMDGCLPANSGRNGKIQTGITYNLAVPPYTSPGAYSTIMTFTLSDNTDNCS